MPMYPGKNNSKKISELKPRDVITQHKDHSWIPVAQFDSRINAYTNFAINIAALTDYTDEFAYNTASDAVSYFADSYNMEDWVKFWNVGQQYNPGYITPELDEAVAYSSIAQNISTYIYSYTDILHNWEYLFGHYEVDIPNRPEYLYTDLEQYILTEDGRKIMIDNG
jgi:hypothetical protein